MSDLLIPLVADARKEIEQVREWLLRPSAERMSACAQALEQATACLEEVSQGVERNCGHDHLKAAISALAAEIREAQLLLFSAGELYFSLMRRRAGAAGIDPREAEPSQPLVAIG